MANGHLTPKQQRFVEEYLIDLNAADAARRAGYAAHTARQQAHDLLTKPYIQDAIAEAQRRRSERTEITQDDVLRELALIAFSDPADILDMAGEQARLKPANAIPQKARRALASVKVRKEKEGTGDDAMFVDVIEYKYWEKTKALAMLAKHLGMLVDRVAPVNPDGKTPYDGSGITAGLLAQVREQLERRRREAGGNAGQPG